jgi:hypothetical protein
VGLTGEELGHPVSERINEDVNIGSTAGGRGYLEQRFSCANRRERFAVNDNASGSTNTATFIVGIDNGLSGSTVRVAESCLRLAVSLASRSVLV